MTTVVRGFQSLLVATSKNSCMQVLKTLCKYSLVEKRVIEEEEHPVVWVHSQLIEVGRQLIDALNPPKYIRNEGFEVRCLRFTIAAPACNAHHCEEVHYAQHCRGWKDLLTCAVSSSPWIRSLPSLLRTSYLEMVPT